MPVKTFVDTNVLIYAHDLGGGKRHELARAAVEQLWQEGNGALSVQVLQEFYVNVRRKARTPLTVEHSRRLVGNYLAWNPIVNDTAVQMSAIEIEERYKLSFWDSMIVAAAQKSSAEILLSEDFNDGQAFGQVLVSNPFAKQES